MAGTVKWFNNRRGYGFITGADGTEVFVHYSAIEADGFKTLKRGAEVSFELGSDETGRVIATNVKAVA